MPMQSSCIAYGLMRRNCSMGIEATLLQRYFAAAAGKGRQSARTTLERLNLKEITCRQAITEIAKMCAPGCAEPGQTCTSPRPCTRMP